jgi:hypothetical protein
MSGIQRSRYRDIRQSDVLVVVRKHETTRLGKVTEIVPSFVDEADIVMLEDEEQNAFGFYIWTNGRLHPDLRYLLVDRRT